MMLKNTFWKSLALGASFAGLLALGAASASAATMATPGAQWPADKAEAREWLDAMPAKAFTNFALAVVDKASVINTDYDWVINPSKDAIVDLECVYTDSRKWQIVGDAPYDNGGNNPHQVLGRSVSKVSLRSFDQWCKSFVAITSGGDTLTGTLNVPGDSVKSFAIIFKLDN